MPAWVLPAAIAAGNVAGNLMDNISSNKTAKRNTDATIRANKQEAELAYQRSMQTWHMQNEYNTPQMQMERFKAAGLNPHLIYGQGSAGLASSPANYSPPNIQYKYEAPAYGSAVSSALPTLMSVGSWMQDMRLTDAQIKKVNVDTDRSVSETIRAQQLIDFLRKRNPQILNEGSNKLSLFPYQESMLQLGRDTSEQKLFELEQEFRYKFGEDLFNQKGSRFTSDKSPIGGLRKLQFLQEQSKTKLLDAKSSWSEFDITDPQAIMQAVLAGVMGLAGQTLRLSTHRKPVVNQKRERPRGLNPRRMGPNHPDRKR